jgi:photosystem II stability/assembly factor-like uncharacterized protein
MVMPAPATRFLFALLIGCSPHPAAATAQVHPGAPSATTTSVPATPRGLKPEDLKGLNWRSVGPANMGGRVADIAVAPGNPKTFYVGFGTGGLFKTTNAGTTFAPVFDKEVTASIGSVVVCDAPPDWAGWAEERHEGTEARRHEGGETGGREQGTAGRAATSTAPADAQKEKGKGNAKIVWVGTGEGNGRNSSSYGHGVYRSTDGGSTFKHCGLADSHDIPRMAVDSRNPDVCYVAALGHLWGPNPERGVYKTTDGGQSWRPVLQIDENTGACDVLVDPQNPETIYAAMYMRRRSPFSFRSGGPEGGIYRSTDGGANWTKLTKGLPAQTGRIGLDLYQKDPRILYAIIESDVGGWGVEPFDDRSKEGGLFRSEDRGETWTRVHDHTPRAFYFSKVRIDPTDDQRIYVLGWGLNISDDGGRTFRAGGARKPHGDLHAMVINPADRDHLYLGTDGGVYISHDRAATWDFLNHLATGEFYNVTVDMSEPYRIAGGLQDNGSWYGPSATILDVGSDEPGKPGGGITNADWKFIWWGDGFHCAFDPLDPNILYAEWQGGELVRVNVATGQRKKIAPSPKEGQPRFRFNWNSPFFVSPHNPTTLYFAGNHVFKLTDRGDRWERISDDLTTRAIEKIESQGSTAENHGTVVALAESPLAAGMLWAGTDDGLIHVKRDDGRTWTNVTPAEVGGCWVNMIEPSHHDRETAYAVIDGHRNDDMQPHLLVTRDGGNTWQSIVGDLPAGRHCKVIREDRKNPRVLYAGTENACYVSIDGGEHWIKLNGDSLPTVAVDDLVQHPREMDLVAGTHGRSIYVLDDASPLSQLTPEIVQSDFHAFDIQPARPRLFLWHAGCWTERAFVGANPPLGAKIHYWIRDYTGDEVTVTIKDAKDIMVRKLTGASKPGINRVVWDLQTEGYDKLPDYDAQQLGQTLFGPPGEYTATISYGKKSATKKIMVLPGTWGSGKESAAR